MMPGGSVIFGHPRSRRSMAPCVSTYPVAPTKCIPLSMQRKSKAPRHARRAESLARFVVKDGIIPHAVLVPKRGADEIFVYRSGAIRLELYVSRGASLDIVQE